MNIEELREYCLSVKGATESFPFDDTMLVFKILGKIFAYIIITDAAQEFKVNVKCDPLRTVELREHYRGIVEAPYNSGKLWNAVYLDSDVPDKLIMELIGHSVEEVLKKMPRKKKEEYDKL